MLRVARFGCGLVVGGGLAAVMLQRTLSAKDEVKGAFRPDAFLPFRLRETIPLSADCSLFRFDLPDHAPETGLPVASCIVTRFQQAEGQYVIRPYTPTTLSDVKGHFDLVIKKYPGAKMGGHIFSLKPGDFLDVKGPILKIQYEPNKYKHLGMIAGGTGITPMYQVIQEVLKNPDDRTEVDLIYANKSPQDILLRKELDALARKHNNFRVHYTVDQAGWLWLGDTGHVGPETVQKRFPAPSPQTFVYVCGPPPMMNAVTGPKNPDYSQGELKGFLKGIGYTEANVFKF
jgi:cytochrome-b5 reductase